MTPFVPYVPPPTPRQPEHCPRCGKALPEDYYRASDTTFRDVVTFMAVALVVVFQSFGGIVGFMDGFETDSYYAASVCREWPTSRISALAVTYPVACRAALWFRQPPGFVAAAPPPPGTCSGFCADAGTFGSVVYQRPSMVVDGIIATDAGFYFRPQRLDHHTPVGIWIDGFDAGYQTALEDCGQ